MCDLLCLLWFHDEDVADRYFRGGLDSTQHDADGFYIIICGNEFINAIKGDRLICIDFSVGYERNILCAAADLQSARCANGIASTAF